jgi:AcrR family transcriptional regulator
MEYSEKQLQIIDVAEGLFATNGFEGTSVRDIAQKAGVNIAMISYYFGSKEKLMQAIFEKGTESVRTQVNSMLGNNELTSLQKVNILIDDYVNRIIEKQEFHKLLMREQMINKDNPVTCIIHDTKKQNLLLIKKLIQEGQKSGEFKKNIDIMMMMNTLIGTGSHLIATQHFYREINNLQTMEDNEFKKLIKRKLSHHLKSLFKATLTYEA